MTEKLEEKIAKHRTMIAKHRKLHGNKWMTKGPTEPSASRTKKVHGSVHEEYTTYWKCTPEGWASIKDEKSFSAKEKLAKFLKQSDKHIGEIRTAVFIDDVYQETRTETVTG